MAYIDTHTHLYTEEFTADIEQLIYRAGAAGVTTMYMPAIDSTCHEAMFQLEARFPGQCIAMMGLHPCYVKENYQDELNKVAHWLSTRKFAAVGEVGLDFYWDTTFTTQQYQAFEQQMQWALQYSLPVVIHTRNAMQQTINAVKPYASQGLTGIFHCFGETYEYAKQIIDMNFLLGIGGVVTYKKSPLPQTLQQIGLQHLVLETDAPYLSPVPYRGKRNESSYLTLIAQAIATIKQVSVDQVATITTQNAEQLFAL
jgi:TatD DNase family protein